MRALLFTDGLQPGAPSPAPAIAASCERSATLGRLPFLLMQLDALRALGVNDLTLASSGELDALRKQVAPWLHDFNWSLVSIDAADADAATLVLDGTACFQVGDLRRLFEVAGEGAARVSDPVSGLSAWRVGADTEGVAAIEIDAEEQVFQARWLLTDAATDAAPVVRSAPVVERARAMVVALLAFLPFVSQ